MISALAESTVIRRQIGASPFLRSLVFLMKNNTSNLVFDNASYIAFFVYKVNDYAPVNNYAKS
ncbi:hypothetical protein SDC9_192969 [bioreactor metagenome]|uniref:Uncharacterized protein n=1 Tax=bioreactor metagenome TaxID=1076179 RepID=A0A645I3Q4_9ZZZZ